MRASRLCAGLTMCLFVCLSLPLIAVEGLFLVEETQTQNAESAGLEIRAFLDGKELKGGAEGAEVRLNHRFAGRTPFSAAALAPGFYLIELISAGATPRTELLELRGGKAYTIRCELIPLKGFLRVLAEPADAELLIDGQPIARIPGELERILSVRAGEHRIRVRRFGYVEEQRTILIQDKEFISLEIRLSKAKFGLSAPEISRKRFNPDNPGKLGRVEIGFTVSAPGAAYLEIRDSTGRLVHADSKTDLSDWAQSFTWDGLDDRGDGLPDGLYELALWGEEAEGREFAPNSMRPPYRASIEIDSGLVYRIQGSSGALPGLRFLPDTLGPYDGLGFTEARASYEYGMNRLGLELSGFFSTDGLSFGYSVEGGLGEGADGAFRMGFGLLYGLGSEGNAASGLPGNPAEGRKGAAAAAFRFSAELGPTENFSFEFLLPLALRLDSWLLGLSPGLETQILAQEESYPISILLGAGLARSSRLSALGLSGRAALRGLATGDPSFGGIDMALEAWRLLAPSALTLSGALVAIWEPGSELRLQARFGLGFPF